MAHLLRLDLIVQGTDAVSAAPNSIPVLVAHSDIELVNRITMAVNFLRCGTPAVHLLVYRPLGDYRQKLWETLDLIEDKSTETLGFEGKDGNEYDIFRLFRDPVESPALAPIEHSGPSIRELND